MAASHQPMAFAGRSVVAALVVGALSRTASAQAWPEVVLYTMGPGNDVFSRFGHAAMCVRDAETPEGRCYNYGTADFTTPAPLTWSIVRGRGRFWVSVVPEAWMLEVYGPREDRDLFRQVLPFDHATRVELARRLAYDAELEHRYFVYHHYRDNCTTRLRDHLDRVTHGALSRGASQSTDVTWRDDTREGFGSSVGLLVVSDVFLGRRLDAVMSEWERMFLPRVFRASVASRLGAAPARVWSRRAPVVVAKHGARRAFWWALVAALAGVLGVARWRQWGAVSRAVGGLVGIVALVVWTMALVSGLPELWMNELVFVALPTDAVMGLLPERVRRPYGLVRLTMLALVALGALVGVVRQPVLGMVAVVAMLMASQLPPRARAPRETP